jgi:3-oxoacyl-[acyl-carrier-protein] synthase II
MTALERIVVTGMGPVAPNGVGLRAFWGALVEGRSAIRPIRSIDVSRHPRKVGGEVLDFVPTQFMSEQAASETGRTAQLAIAAGRLALKDAGLDDAPPNEPLLAIGSTFGELAEVESIDDDWLRDGAVDPRKVARQDSAAFAPRVSKALRLADARVTTVHAACSSSNQAVALAAQALREGRCSFALAGGADGFSRVNFSGFARLGAMAPERCAPFDKNRKGMLVSEGAGIVVLERLESAARRGARVYAEILGWGLSCDAIHLASPLPDGSGLAQAMTAAIRTARLEPGAIDLVGAHGTGTVANDRTETRALYSVLGSRASTVPTTSIKSMIGHTMGAANILQLMACILAMRESLIPPTINFETPDPDCAVDCVPNRARRARTTTALVNGAGFGGNNSCLVVTRCSL